MKRTRFPRSRRLGVGLLVLVVQPPAFTRPAAGATVVRSQEGQPQATLHPVATISTSMGDIVVELNAEVAPLSCMNFLQYAVDGYYSGTILHRVKDYLIQGGAYTADLEEKTEGLRDPIPNESMRGLDNVRGSIALYRKPFGRDTAQAQFFINAKDNSQLNRLRDGAGYAVFGKVVEGMEVVDKITGVEVSSHPRYAAGRSAVVPKTPVVIRSITIGRPLDKKRAFEIAVEFEERTKDPVPFKVRDLEKKYGKKAAKTDSGLIYIDIVEGAGTSPLGGDTVEVEYEARLLDAEEPFDSSLKQWNRAGKLRYDTILKGMREMLSSMREGGRRIAIIPPHLAFGAEGWPGKVPGDAPLIYEVHLLGVSLDEPDE